MNLFWISKSAVLLLTAGSLGLGSGISAMAERNAVPASDETAASDPSESFKADSLSDETAAENPQADFTAYIGSTGFASVQAALNSIGENGTAVIDLKQNSKDGANILKGQNVTINVFPGVIWDNENSTDIRWENSTLVNQGTLILNNQGTILAKGSQAQSMCFINAPGAIMTINGGTYTSEHGDYLGRNFGTMTINDHAYFEKNIAGSPSMLTNGWMNPGTIGSNPPARLTVNSITIKASVINSIGIKNDDHSILTFNGGSITAGIDIQNGNIAQINGGEFTSMSGSGCIYNRYANDQYEKGQLTINGGNFWHTGNSTNKCLVNANSNGSIQIYGGTYFNGESTIKDNVVKPRELRQIPNSDRYEVVLPVTSVRITPEKESISAGESMILKASVLPEDATYRKVTWTNETEDLIALHVDENDPLHLTVSVKGLKEGIAKVKATADGVAAEIEFPITKEVITPVLKVTPAQKTLRPKETFNLQASLEPAPEPSASAPFVYTSSDPKVASVDENGKVTAIARGKAVITVTWRDQKAECHVIVEEEKSNSAPDEIGSNASDKPSSTVKKKPVNTGASSQNAVISYGSAVLLSAAGLLFLKKKRRK